MENKNVKILSASLIYTLVGEIYTVIAAAIMYFGSGTDIDKSLFDCMRELMNGESFTVTFTLLSAAFKLLVMSPLSIGINRYTADVLNGRKTKGIFYFYRSPSMYINSAVIVLAVNIPTYIKNIMPAEIGLSLIISIAILIYGIFIFLAEYYYSLYPEKGAGEAISKSIELVKGHKAAVFGMQLLVGVISCVALIIVFVPAYVGVILTIPLGVFTNFVGLRLLVPFACNIIEGKSDDDEEEYEGEPVTEQLSDDEIFVEDKSFGGIISEEYDYPENVDIIALIEKMDISYSVIADYEVRKKFRMMFKKACEEVADFESYLNGKSCTLTEDCECSEHYLTLRLTFQRDGDYSPYRLTLETEEQNDLV